MRVPPVRFGVLGCGVIAYWTHLRELTRVPGATLVAAADPDAGARARAKALTGVPVHEHADQLIARADIDAVIISAPSHLHADLAVAACGAGKHVYIEKPIATTAEDARRVSAAAAQSRTVVGVGFNRRFHPSFQQARALLAARRIGPVRAIHTAFAEPASEDPPEWRRCRVTGGGVLLDLASHHIDLLRWFLDDEVSEVDARLVSEVTEDDSAWVRIVMCGGTSADCFFSYRTGRIDAFQFLGAEGTLRIDRYRPSVSLRLARRHGYGVREAIVPPSSALLAWRLTRWVRPSYESSFRRALAAFVRTVQGTSAGNATLTDGLRSLEVILAAEASARSASPVTMPGSALPAGRGPSGRA